MRVRIANKNEITNLPAVGRSMFVKTECIFGACPPLERAGGGLLVGTRNTNKQEHHSSYSNAC